MEKSKNDRIDEIIIDVLHEDLNQINIDEEKIEREWRKIENKIKIANETKKRKIAQIAVAAAMIVISLISFELFIPGEVTATKSSSVKKIIDLFDKKTTIKNNSSINENNETSIENEISEMEISLEDAQDIMSFKIKELPFERDGSVIVRSSNDKPITVIMNYVNDKGDLAFYQSSEGEESQANINVSKNNKINKIEIDGIEVAHINIGEKISKATWSYFGIGYVIDADYVMSDNEVKEIIKAMR
jgi:hypothetical protein